MLDGYGRGVHIVYMARCNLEEMDWTKGARDACTGPVIAARDRVCACDIKHRRTNLEIVGQARVEDIDFLAVYSLWRSCAPPSFDRRQGYVLSSHAGRCSAPALPVTGTVSDLVLCEYNSALRFAPVRVTSYEAPECCDTDRLSGMGQDDAVEATSRILSVEKTGRRGARPNRGRGGTLVALARQDFPARVGRCTW